MQTHNHQSIASQSVKEAGAKKLNLTSTVSISDQNLSHDMRKTTDTMKQSTQR